MKGIAEYVSRNGGIQIEHKWYNPVDRVLAEETASRWQDLVKQMVVLDLVSDDIFSSVTLFKEPKIDDTLSLSIIAFELKEIREILRERLTK
jgi:hypothetical protein